MNQSKFGFRWTLAAEIICQSEGLKQFDMRFRFVICVGQKLTLDLTSGEYLGGFKFSFFGGGKSL